MLKINIITPFPDVFDILFNYSILLKAKEKKEVEYNIFNLFDYLDNPSQRIDDYPFGGGDGMILKPEPLSNAINDILVDGNKDCKVVFPTPDGELFNHSMAKDFSNNKELTFICGHYKGIDQRIRDKYVTDEVSIGDYVLTSGELPTMIMIDSIVRLKEGVLNNYNSACKDSFYDLLLDGPHYTRPRKFKNMCVPEEILSGNHKEIEKWFLRKREEKTKLKREDLYIKYKSSKKDREKNV
tara:strand:+ start:838 stop:1557 length:720 start_codon:yes stop_codon:yes gene_type:complete